MTTVPRVFISWSGESRDIASALCDLLDSIFDERINFWTSYQNIKPGERWSDALDRELETSNFGIICLVPNNLMAPWIHYEAGALSKTKTVNSAVVPYCMDLGEGELRDPLSRFQAVVADRDGTLGLVSRLNALLDEKGALNKTDLQRQFRDFWPDLEERLREIRSKLTGTRLHSFKCLSVSELLRRECLRDDAVYGELRDPTHIYINASEPIESQDPRYARQVMKNIRREARYYYVFKLRPENGEHIANMIVKLARVPQDRECEIKNRDMPGLSDAGPASLGELRADSTTIGDNIDRLRRLFCINMVEESYGLEYCILNANHENHAHCYLRMPRLLGAEDERRWIDWTSGHTACKIAEQVKDLRLDSEAERQQIIRSSKGCEFYVDPRLVNQRAQFVDELTNTIRRSADGELASRLIQLCIGR